MNRWLASRWMIISVTLSGAALGLSVWLEDASPFTAVATATIALGQAKNMMDNRRRDKSDDA
jgi:hypothetical protein